MRTLVFIVFLLLPAFLAAQSNERAELEKKKKQTQQEIDVLNRQYEEIKRSKKESLGQLTLIQSKIRLRNQVIDNINKQVRVIDGQINESYREMRRLRKDLDTLKMDYAQNVVYAYKNRSKYDFLNFLFSATSFNDAMRRVNYMRAYQSYRTQQVEAIQKTEVLYKQKITELTNNRKEKSSVLQDQTKEMGELVKDKKEQDEVVNKLKKREKEVNNMIASKRKQANQLEAAIKAVVQREIAAARKEAERKVKEDRDRKEKEEKDRLAREKATANPAEDPAVSKPVTTAPVATAPVKKEEPKRTASYLEYNKEDLALGTSFENSRGRLPYPVDNGYVAIPFGSYTVPGTSIKGSQDFITIASPVGTNVKSVFEGEVVSVFDVGGMSAVMLKHGKYFTTYSNLSAVTVSKGQQVKVGQVLGKVGSNLEGDGQLDFILTREAQMLNPQSWLRGN
ncbi:MAG TPA: peptidoglycan DD-metalloendopeptidase family protein [Lacibacter sp.]|nr:peptidoglycan DD-metalloendopeptidase family protein [Lacibacter sp.]HMO88805.1 peptidoglycan DD-metalloendopeptidase family protein [Lacibacter sp.]